MNQGMLEEFYQLYADDVFQYARYCLRNREDALDVVQEVFMKAHRAIDRFQNRSSPKTWLMTITRHTIADFFKYQKRDKRHTPHPYDEQFTSDPMHVVSSRLDIQDALNLLRPSDRQVFVLRYIVGLSVRDTAESMNWTEEKVRVNLHRANRKLRVHLGNYKTGGDLHVRLK